MDVPYWISSISSVRITTAPGVAATSTPRSKSCGSERTGSRGGVRTSFEKRRAPVTRFAPPVSIIAFSDAGLVRGKFAGDRAATRLLTAIRSL